jgi:hypothetical protein
MAAVEKVLNAPGASQTERKDFHQALREGGTRKNGSK